jgi:hypothetical protein
MSNLHRTKTIRIPFITRITTLATDTALGTATEHTFTAQTVNMPETTRTIRFARIITNVRDNFTVATDFDGFRCGVQINAVAFSDTDVTFTNANSGDHGSLELSTDVTSYFVTNDPGATSFTVGVRTRFATGSASNVNGVAAVLEITYDYDESQWINDGTPTTLTSMVKTVAIPIQTHHTTLTTSYQEIGIASTSPAPANQIPILTSTGALLPEASVSVKYVWLELQGTEGGTSTGLTMTVRVDGSTDMARYTTALGLGSNPKYFDRIITAGSNNDINLSTTAAHALEAKSSTTATFECIGAVMYVTYTFDPTTTTTVLNSVLAPLTAGTQSAVETFDSTTTDNDLLVAFLNIQEPGPIYMKQSGVLSFSNANNVTLNAYTAGQAARAYTIASNAIRCGNSPIIQRGDHSLSIWSLRRGWNRLAFGRYNSVETSPFGTEGGYAIINYYSAVHDASSIGGSDHAVGAHAHTTVWPIGSGHIDQNQADQRLNRTTTAPIIAETYQLIGAAIDAQLWPATSLLPSWVYAERQAQELEGSGWSICNICGSSASGAVESGTKRTHGDITDWWRTNPSSETSTSAALLVDTERLDVETSRDWQLQVTTPTSWTATMWLTYHSIGWKFQQTYSHDGAPQASITDEISVFGYDEISGLPCYVQRDLDTDGSGDYTFVAFDDSLLYQATVEGVTLGGYPGASFKCALNSDSAGSGKLRGDASRTEAPKIVGRGAAATGTGDIVPAVPDHQQWDVLVLICQSLNGEAVSMPTGWTQAADSPQNATACRLTVGYRRATSRGYNTISAPTVTDSGNHTMAQIVCIRGCVRSGDPFDVTAGSTAASSTSVSVPGDTTTVPNTLVLAIVANATDTATLQASAWANTDLIGFRAYASFNAVDNGRWWFRYGSRRQGGRGCVRREHGDARECVDAGAVVRRDEAPRLLY